MPPPSSDIAIAHEQRLASWRQRHPGSPHPLHDLERLEQLKAANDRLAELDLRERPEVCRSLPTFLTVGNTHKCNLTCGMCFKQLDDANNMSLPDMGLSNFESLAHELFPHLRKIALSVSGDPLVSRTLMDELDLMSTYAVRAYVTTNGMTLSRRGLYEHLLPALDTLVISMDGASEPVFNALRRGASFKRVVENIRRFNEARDALPKDSFRPALHFNTILQKFNVAELPRLIELAGELSVEHVTIDHVLIHEGLNERDSLDDHHGFSNRMLEEAERIARRLGIELRLPIAFTTDADRGCEAPELPSDEALLAEGVAEPQTVPFDPNRHERWWEDPEYAALQRVAKEAGSNRDLIEELLEIRQLKGHLLWGVPQLGPAMTPPDRKKVSSCTYPWVEAFVEYNGLVAPCCNPAMSAARIMGLFESGTSFRDIWNGEAYRNLRTSLTSGDCYRFCRTCYLVEPPDEADWGSTETWIKVGADLEQNSTALAGVVPEGKQAFVTEIRSSAVAEGDCLEILADDNQVLSVEARRENGSHWSFARTIPTAIAIPTASSVRLRSNSSAPVRVDLIAYIE